MPDQVLQYLFGLLTLAFGVAIPLLPKNWQKIISAVLFVICGLGYTFVWGYIKGASDKETQIYATLTAQPKTTTATCCATPEVFDVRDDFDGNSLDSTKWVSESRPVKPTFQNGALSLNAVSQGEFSEGLIAVDQSKRFPLRVIAVRVTVRQAAPASRTGLSVSLCSLEGRKWYVWFMIQEDGDIYIGRGPEGPTDWEKVQGGGGLGQPHVLRVEWTDTEALFSVDAKLVKSLPCNNEFGSWGSLYASAIQGGKTINAFDWAAWTFK